jgi:rare lipoprotein A (peptidoglycan hydrolase)
MSVAVCRTNGGAMACVRVTLSDFMRADRLIDLDSRSFAALAPLSQGIVKVSVTP